MLFRTEQDTVNCLPFLVIHEKWEAASNVVAFSKSPCDFEMTVALIQVRINETAID